MGLSVASALIVPALFALLSLLLASVTALTLMAFHARWPAYVAGYLVLLMCIAPEATRLWGLYGQ